MWAETLSDPSERQAFHAVLAEYFQRPCPTSPRQPPSTTASSNQAAANPDLPARRTVAPVPSPSCAASRPPQTVQTLPKERPTGPRRPAGLESQQSEQPPVVTNKSGARELTDHVSRRDGRRI